MVWRGVSPCAGGTRRVRESPHVCGMHPTMLFRRRREQTVMATRAYSCGGASGYTLTYYTTFAY
ncbi:hypothetical protein FACS1894133_0410 [Clostridia bacterium]|nr:hypothetical protein FACS1894133_0380 [Clostridia bacterium]GHU57488.1 hypothetical protein FACS1894133_0410 [Clostridia bacterium]